MEGSITNSTSSKPWMRGRLPGLRQRRLAGHLLALWNPNRCGAGLDQPSSIRTIGMGLTDVTEKAGLRRTGWASGVTASQITTTMASKISSLPITGKMLYKNNGDGTFTDVTVEAGLSYSGPPRWGSGCTFLDYDRDGHLDLFVANYVKIDLDKIPKPGDNPMCNYRGIPANCGPNGTSVRP